MDHKKIDAQDNKLPKWVLYAAVGFVVLFAAVLLIIVNAKTKETQRPPVRTEQATTLPTGGEELQNTASTSSADSTESISEATQGQNPQQGESVDPQDPTSQPEQTDPIPTMDEGAPYEDRLAAAMVIGISMQYAEFEFEGIYAASETSMGNYMNSAGAYVVFRGDGQWLALRSQPIAAERSDKGTADLYLPALGYATYELVDPQTVPGTGLREMQLEDLEELILQSAQVTIIER